MFERILVPLDGSAVAQAALVYAGSIPSRTVRLLTVLSDEDAGIGFAPLEVQSQWRSEWQNSIEAQLTSLAQSLRDAGRNVEIDVVFGRPAEWIETYAQDADLVIMTTQGRGAGGRAVFGSVADRVARTSKTPVMMIRGGDRPVPAQAIVRFIVGLDGSDLAEQSLPLVSKLATELGVPVLLVRVIDLEQLGLAAQLATSPVAQYAASVDTVRQGVDDYLQSHAATLRDAGIAVETAVLDGSPAPVLNDLTLPGDVLVLTSHGRGGIGRWLLGSVTEKLVREGNTPVIVVRSHALAES